MGVGDSRRPQLAITFILTTILIDTIGFGMIAPVMPELIRELSGEGFAEAVRYGGALMFLFAAVQFFAAPILGNLGEALLKHPAMDVNGFIDVPCFPLSFGSNVEHRRLAGVLESGCEVVHGAG